MIEHAFDFRHSLFLVCDSCTRIRLPSFLWAPLMQALNTPLAAMMSTHHSTENRNSSNLSSSHILHPTLTCRKARAAFKIT